MTVVGYVNLNCQNTDCGDSAEIEVTDTTMSKTVETMAEEEGWGFADSGRFLCTDCLDAAQGGE